MGQGQLQRVGAGLYSLLENILLWDIRDQRLAPTRVPLTLLRLKPFRGYLRMTHSCCSGTETCTYKKSLKKLSRVWLIGTKNAVSPSQRGQLANSRSCLMAVELGMTEHTEW